VPHLDIDLCLAPEQFRNTDVANGVRRFVAIDGRNAVILAVYPDTPGDLSSGSQTHGTLGHGFAPDPAGIEIAAYIEAARKCFAPADLDQRITARAAEELSANRE
jgi:hypothetical protein